MNPDVLLSKLPRQWSSAQSLKAQSPAGFSVLPGERCYYWFPVVHPVRQMT